MNFNKPHYLIVAGGDGYQTTIVPEDKLDEGYLRMVYGEKWMEAPAQERSLLLEHMHDLDMNWERADGIGVRYRDNGCSGYIEVIRIEPTTTSPAKQLVQDIFDELVAKHRGKFPATFYGIPLSDLSHEELCAVVSEVEELRRDDAELCKQNLSLYR